LYDGGSCIGVAVAVAVFVAVGDGVCVEVAVVVDVFVGVSVAVAVVVGVFVGVPVFVGEGPGVIVRVMPMTGVFVTVAACVGGGGGPNWVGLGVLPTPLPPWISGTYTQGVVVQSPAACTKPSAAIRATTMAARARGAAWRIMAPMGY
jgi:hypothetical protein